MAIRTKEQLFDRLALLIRSNGQDGKTRAVQVREFMVDLIDTMFNLVKLYASTGTATDAPMHQKAVTDALATKAPLVEGKVPSQYLPPVPSQITTDYHPLRFNSDEIAGDESEPGFITKILAIPFGEPVPAQGTRIEFANKYGVFFSEKVLTADRRSWELTYPTDSEFVTFHYFSTELVGQPENTDGGIPTGGTANDVLRGDGAWANFGNWVRSIQFPVLNMQDVLITVNDTLDVLLGKLQGQINAVKQKIVGTATRIPYFGTDTNITSSANLVYNTETGLTANRMAVTDAITRIAKYGDHERGKRHTDTRGAWRGLQLKHVNAGPEVFELGSAFYFGLRQSAGIHVFDTVTRTGSRIDDTHGPANGLKLIPAGFPQNTTNNAEIGILGLAVTSTQVWASLNRQASGLPYSLWLWDKVSDTGIDVLATATGIKPPTVATGGWGLASVGNTIYQAHHHGLVEYDHDTGVCRLFASAGGSPVNGELPPAGVCIAVHHKAGKIYTVWNSAASGDSTGLGAWELDLATNTGKRYTTAAGVTTGDNLQSDNLTGIFSSTLHVWFTTQANGAFRLNPATGEGYRYTTSAGVDSGDNFPAGWVNAASYHDNMMYFACTGGGGIQVIDLVTNAGSRITTTTVYPGENLAFNAPQGVHASSYGLWATHRGLGLWERALGPPEPYLDGHLSQLGHTEALIDRKVEAAAPAPVTDERILATPATGYTESAVNAGSRSATDTLITLLSKQGTKIKEFEQAAVPLTFAERRAGPHEFYSPMLDIRGFLSKSVSGGTTMPALPGRIGIMAGNTGGSATGWGGLGRMAFSNSNGVMLLGGYRIVAQALVQVPILSDAAEEFATFFGLSSNGYAAVDGVNYAAITYDRATYGANWATRTKPGSGTPTTFTSAIPVVAGQWYELMLDINAAGTQVDYYIDNTLVHSETVGIPATSTGLQVFMGIGKSVGTGTRYFYIDDYYEKLG